MRVAAGARRIFERARPKGIATGATVRSITVGRVQASGYIYWVRIGPGTHQALYLHEKTPPQRPPPLRNIINWLLVKPGTRGGTIRGLFGLAKYVQTKIAREGTKAFPFMATALKLEIDEVPGILISAVIKEITSR